MSKFYNPLDWYWTVGGDTNRAYSSAVGDYVPPNNTAFVAWKADGTVPSNVANEADLAGILAPYYPQVARPVAAGVLDAYQQAQADDIFQQKLIKYLFTLENRVRVLEAKPAVTVAQARAYFKGLM